jgi:small-conductance mechanosensitive channel
VRIGSHLGVAFGSPGVDETAGELAGSARSIVETVVDAFPRIGAAAVVILGGWALSRLVRRLLRGVLRRRQTPSFAEVISKLVGWSVLVLAVLAAMAVTFPSVRPVDLLAGLGFFSLAIGFAFQDILENTLSGVLLLFRQPFRSGDQIEVQERAGTVEAITIRETRLRTFDGQLVLIPNRDVYKNVIRVQTHFELRRLSFVVGIAYENDPAEAAGVIERSLLRVAGVAEFPAPEALAVELAASTVNIEVRFWTAPNQQEALAVLSRSILATKAELDAVGIEMPAEIVVLQGSPSFGASLRGDVAVTPGGALRER